MTAKMGKVCIELYYLFSIDQQEGIKKEVKNLHSILMQILYL
ncbi:hypothetical protein BACILLUS_003129 [Priestia megaterium]